MKWVLSRCVGQVLLGLPVRSKLQAVFRPHSLHGPCLARDDEASDDLLAAANFLCIPEDATALKLVGIL